MPNIVYVLTNPAMMGLVKIGMTDKNDVRERMSELYSTGVPFPFECVVAREMEDREAADVERALHGAFGRNRVNPSREFFELDPEQVQAILRIMPGRDVTPGNSDEETASQDEDQAAAREYQRRQGRTEEVEFLESLNEHGSSFYQRILALANQKRMQVTWTSKGFSLDAHSKGTQVPVLYGYRPTALNQRMFVGFSSIERRCGVPRNVVEALRRDALDTGQFEPSGRNLDLFCCTELPLNESQLNAVTGWMSNVIDKIREHEIADIANR